MIRKFASLFIISFLFFIAASVAQVAPPAMAMPDEKNMALVDQIIEVTKHEQYFINYCTKKVKAYAQEHKWKTTKTDEILKSIKFRYYSSTIYNSYAFYSTEQLEKLLAALTLLNNDSRNNSGMVLINAMMQSNLELHIESIIEGSYVMKE